MQTGKHGRSGRVARASLEELRLDYEDFLRHRSLPVLPPDHATLVRFKRRRCATLEEVQAWVAEERGHTDLQGKTRTGTDKNEVPMSVAARERPCQSLSSSTLAANAALSLLNLACHLLDRQIAAQAERFEKEGGFTERLYRVRTARRKENR